MRLAESSRGSHAKRRELARQGKHRIGARGRLARAVVEDRNLGFPLGTFDDVGEQHAPAHALELVIRLPFVGDADAGEAEPVSGGELPERGPSLQPPYQLDDGPQDKERKNKQRAGVERIGEGVQ